MTDLFLGELGNPMIGTKAVRHLPQPIKCISRYRTAWSVNAQWNEIDLFDIQLAEGIWKARSEFCLMERTVRSEVVHDGSALQPFN